MLLELELLPLVVFSVTTLVLFPFVVLPVDTLEFSPLVILPVTVTLSTCPFYILIVELSDGCEEFFISVIWNLTKLFS